MNELRFICARLILDERVLKILPVTGHHSDLDTKKTTPNIEVCYFQYFISFSSRKHLRRNPIEDRTISGFSGQKSVPE